MPKKVIGLLAAAILIYAIILYGPGLINRVTGKYYSGKVEFTYQIAGFLNKRKNLTDTPPETIYTFNSIVDIDNGDGDIKTPLFNLSLKGVQLNDNQLKRKSFSIEYVKPLNFTFFIDGKKSGSLTINNYSEENETPIPFETNTWIRKGCLSLESIDRRDKSQEEILKLEESVLAGCVAVKYLNFRKAPEQIREEQYTVKLLGKNGTAIKTHDQEFKISVHNNSATDS